MLVSSDTIGGGVSTSRSTLIDSSITAIGRGIVVNRGAVATLYNTQVVGTPGGSSGIVGGGQGATLVGGSLALYNGSIVTGEQNGVTMVSERENTNWSPSLLINNSTVEGITASGVVVDNIDGYNSVAAAINVVNGGNIIGGNGTLLEVNKANQSDLTVDNSQLRGNVSVADSAQATVILQNKASLTGALIGVNRFTLDNASLTGQVVGRVGKTLDGVVQNNSTVTGDMTNIHTLLVDSSLVIGSIGGDGSVESELTLQNRASFTGGVNDINQMNITGGASWILTGNAATNNLLIKGFGEQRNRKCT